MSEATDFKPEQNKRYFPLEKSLKTWTIATIRERNCKYLPLKGVKLIARVGITNEQDCIAWTCSESSTFPQLLYW